MGRPQKHKPVTVEIEETPAIQEGKKVIQPVSVEYADTAKPTRDKPTHTAPAPKQRGAYLVEGSKRTWMDRGMAELMANTNPKRYSVEY